MQLPGGKAVAVTSPPCSSRVGSAGVLGRRQLGLLILATAALAAAIALLGPEVTAGRGSGDLARSRGSVWVTTSGNHSERHATLPITRSAWQRPRVVISLKPRQLHDPEQGDRLRVSAEQQMTNNCISDNPRCVGPPYTYSPRIEARIELSTGTDPTPARAIVLARGRERCGQAEPHREHHCVLVIDTRQRRLKASAALCASGECRLNLVFSAHDRAARHGDRIMLGGLQPDGSIPQDRGRLNLIHIRPGSRPAAKHRKSTRLRLPAVKPDLRRRSVMSVPVRHLSKGDGLEVSAAVRTSISHLPYSVRQTAQLILASQPDAIEPDRRARRVGGLDGEIGESNGFNCVLPLGGCTTRKVGAIKIRRDPRRRMYVNLVALLGPKRADAGSHDMVRLRSGRLNVVRYPAPRKGRPRTGKLPRGVEMSKGIAGSAGRRNHSDRP